MDGKITLGQEFHDRLLELYWIVGRESRSQGKPYWANYYLREVRNKGGVAAARRLLARPDPQDGFGRVGELGLFRFSVEAAVLDRRFRTLFTSEEISTARRRLAAVGYRPPE